MKLRVPKKKKLMKIIKKSNVFKSDKIFFKIYILFTTIAIILIQKEKFKPQNPKYLK